jgi:hypothetical protein
MVYVLCYLEQFTQADTHRRRDVALICLVAVISRLLSAAWPLMKFAWNPIRRGINVNKKKRIHRSPFATRDSTVFRSHGDPVVRNARLSARGPVQVFA